MQLLMSGAALGIRALSTLAGAIKRRVAEYQVGGMGRRDILDTTNITLDRANLVHLVSTDVSLEELEERGVSLDGLNLDVWILKSDQKGYGPLSGAELDDPCL